MDGLEEKILNFNLDEDDHDQGNNLVESKIEQITTKFYDSVSFQYSILSSIWTEIGLPKIKLEARIDEINEILNDNLNSILEVVSKEENNTLTKLHAFKKKKLSELNNFLEDLDLNKFDLNYNLSLLSQIKSILIKLEEINAIKIERFEKWNFYLKKFQLLIKSLDLDVKPNFEKSVPTLFEINELKKQIKLNEVNLEKHKKKFSLLQPEIVKLFDQLEIDPRDEFEEMILFNKKNEFIFSDINLNKLENLKQNLCKQIEDNKLKVEELKQKYINLSRLVFIKQDEIDKFLYLNDQKISKLENELINLKWKYEENREIYEKLNEWTENANKLSKLNINNNDPNRFKNRGCSLLKDEQTRNSLKKQLNKLEYDLKVLISKWINEHDNEKFLIYDLDILDYFDKVRNDLYLTCKTEKKKGIGSRVSNYSSIALWKKDQTMINSVCKSPLRNIHGKTIKKSFSNRSNLMNIKTTLKKNKENAFDVSSLLRKIDEINQSTLNVNKSRLPFKIKSNQD